MPIPSFLVAALAVPATTYGHGEHMCGDPGKPRPCTYGAVTASGRPFRPSEPMVAVHVPPEVTHRVRLRPGRWYVCFRHAEDGRDVWLPVLDKKGNKGFDINPSGLRALGIEPLPWWSGKLSPCAAQFIYDTHRSQ